MTKHEYSTFKFEVLVWRWSGSCR